MLILGVTVLCLLKYAASQNSACDYVQNLEVGRTYNINSPNYPNSYGPGLQCRWIAISPAGYVNQIDCVLAVYQSPSCSQDRLMISKSGDPQLAGAAYYCGRGTASATSSGQQMSIGFISSRNSGGGSFTCTVYAKKSITTPETCSCGYRKLNRIVGGQETGVNEYPSMAALVERRTVQIKCGATIIDKRYLLTAAHCTLNYSPDDVAIVVGEHNVTTGDSPATKAYRISKFIVHRLFTETNYDYDIAIVVLSEDIVMSDRVGPACLPFKFVNSDMTGQKVTILGWGTLYPGGPMSKVLQKVDVAVISDNECRSVVSTLSPRQICTYSLGKDACQNDSGGPLLYTDPSTGSLFLVGVVSYGRFCATRGQPGVNTRITALLEWIQSNTQANYCKK